MFVDVIEAEYIDDYKIRITLSNGQGGIVDFEQELWGPVFEPLKNKVLFRNYRISKTLGTIEWENGADIAPEYLEDKLPKNNAQTYFA